MHRPLRWARLLCGAALAIAASPGWAHTTKGVGDFHAGFLHPLTAPEHVIAFAALGILASQQGRWGLRALVLFWIAGAVGATAALWIPGNTFVDLTNIASMVALGGMIAANLSYPPIILYLLAVVVGLTHGLANGTAIEPPLKAILFIPGYVVASVVTVSIGLVVTDWLLQRNVEWVKIAVRVAGSWIAAIGLLVLAGNWNALTS